MPTSLTAQVAEMSKADRESVTNALQAQVRYRAEINRAIFALNAAEQHASRYADAIPAELRQAVAAALHALTG